MINCRLSNKLSEQNEQFKSSEHVHLKGVQLKRGHGIDKGTERSSLQSFHLHYNGAVIALVHTLKFPLACQCTALEIFKKIFLID